MERKQPHLLPPFSLPRNLQAFPRIVQGRIFKPSFHATDTSPPDHDDGRHQARRGHILDTRILLLYAQNQQDHQIISVTDSSLRAVSLLVTLRQDIFISFLTRTPPPPSPLADDHHHLLPGISSSSYDHHQPNSNNVESRRLRESAEPNNGQHVAAAPIVDDDYTHAAHIITLTADVLTACHSSGRMSIETWRRLHARLTAWERAKPPSFRPVRYERAATASSVGGVGGEGGGGVACNGCGGGGGGGGGKAEGQQPPRFFPRIWFANDCHSEYGRTEISFLRVFCLGDPNSSSSPFSCILPDTDKN